MSEFLKAKQQIIESRDALIDAHTHAGFDAINALKRRYPVAQNIADMVRKMKANGVDYALTFPCPSDLFWYNPTSVINMGIWEVLESPAEEFPYQRANESHFYEVRKFGNGYILPFANIFPGVEEGKQIDFINELIKGDLLFGLKLHTLATHTKPTELKESKFIELAEEFSLPIVIHSGPDEFSDPNLTLEVARTYP